MLQFLRKYQKIFFLIITAAVIVSFCFFGTYSTLGPQGQVADREVVKGVCGKPILQQELTALCRLIESSPFDRAGLEKGRMPNFLSDGVIEKDFIASGLGVMLMRRYFDGLKGDLDTRIKKIKSFRPYTHPKMASLSVERIWGQFAPAMLEHFKALKMRSDQATTETLALMTQLYLDQLMLSPDMLKHVLHMQEEQLGIEKDPLLQHVDLSLFGFQSIEEWFGPAFVPLVGQFILNAAQVAEERGYAIKNEEVRAELYQNIYHGYQQLGEKTPLSAAEADQYYHRKMQGLGLDEPTLLSAWKKVMLFRRLFEDASGSVLIDRLAYEQFDRFAKEGVRVSLYQLPSALQLADFRSMLKFQVYLEGVAGEKMRTELALPQQIASLEQIEKRAPELVQRKFTLEYRSVSKEDLAAGISVKETLEWEGENAHWEILRKKFSEVAQLKADSKEARLAALDKLDPKVRVKVDRFARLKMVEGEKEKIKAALADASIQSVTGGIRLKGGDLPFASGKDNRELLALLENASLKEEVPNVAAKQLQLYTPDEEHYYALTVISKESEKKVLTFTESAKDGTLDRMLDERLESAYSDVRRKNTSLFQDKNGEWRPFKEVKDQVGRYVFADLLKVIEQHYQEQSGVLPGISGELPLSFYSNARLLKHMREAKHHLEQNPDDPRWLKTEAAGDPLLAEWRIEKKEQTLERCAQVSFSKEEMFALSAQNWSSVALGERGNLAFYFVHGKETSSVPPLEAVERGHQILSYDAKKDMMGLLLEKIEQKKAIALSVDSR